MAVQGLGFWAFLCCGLGSVPGQRTGCSAAKKKKRKEENVGIAV